MNWHVFKRDDPDTWPKIDCPMLVYCDLFNILYVCKWDNNINKFFEEVDCDKRFLHHFRECFYAYIGYLPYIEKECHPAKCKGDRYLCSEYDDGYYLGDDLGCKGMEIVTEYSIGHKRIWKEF